MNRMNEFSLDVGGVDLVAWIGKQGKEDMVAIRPLCEALGIDNKNQQRKVLSDPKYLCGYMTMHDSSGREQSMLCIPVRKVSGWLYSINSNKVRPEVAEKLLIFQEHLQVVMHAYVTGTATGELLSAFREETATLRGMLATVIADGARKDAVIARQGKQIERLTEIVETHSDHWATAASHGMHAAKKRKQILPN